MRMGAEVKNGEGIVGHHYLHGSNADVGDFQITGEATRKSTDSGTEVAMKLGFTWNDKIDPNPQYSTDIVKSTIGKIITFGLAKDYEIQITWSSEATVTYDTLGRRSQMSGYPLQ